VLGKIERQLIDVEGIREIIGVDEVGRGCIAGPVYAACVALDYDKLWRLKRDERKIIRDSKLLSDDQRRAAVPLIRSIAIEAYVGIADTSEVESIGILQACFLAMARAIAECKHTYRMLLMDGKLKHPDYEGEQRAIVSGDNLCFSIAAASILAKVERDTYMREQSKLYPGYGFESHVGYGTKFHLESLKTLGVCDLHRKNFAPIRHMTGRQPIAGSL